MSASDKIWSIILDKRNENINYDEELLVEHKSKLNENNQLEESITLSYHINKDAMKYTGKINNPHRPIQDT